MTIPECPECGTNEHVESLGHGIAGPEFYCLKCFTNWTDGPAPTYWVQRTAEIRSKVGKSINRPLA